MASTPPNEGDACATAAKAVGQSGVIPAKAEIQKKVKLHVSWVPAYGQINLDSCLRRNDTLLHHPAWPEARPPSPA
jgi:hypothetical protein